MIFNRGLVVGASGGIGGALAALLDDVTVGQITRLSRADDGLDITCEDSVAAAARALKGPFDLVIDATGALSIDGHLPEKSLAALDPSAMARQFAVNAIGPALLLKHFGPKLPRKGRAVFASLSARVGSIGDNQLGGWYSYRAAKAALNQVVRSAAIEHRRRNSDSIIVALHPGTVQTTLTQSYLARYDAVPPPDAARRLIKVIGGLTPGQTGGFFDYSGAEIPW